jgi:2-dehydro-3-deoxygluconokinase
MVELSQAGEGLLRRGFAGDTFNTAWYARACLPADWSVDYLTALGDDPMSTEMLTFMKEAGIGTQAIRRIPGKTPGLYLITLKNGERTFSYWRDTAAARKLADDADHLRQQIERADIVYFSGITLGILTPEAIDTLLAELRRAKAAGRRVAFDPNLRPRLWTDKETMLKTISDGARAASLVLPSFDDETTHFGDGSVAETIARYHGLGVDGVVVKNGDPCPRGRGPSGGGYHQRRRQLQRRLPVAPRARRLASGRGRLRCCGGIRRDTSSRRIDQPGAPSRLIPQSFVETKAVVLGFAFVNMLACAGTTEDFS